MESLTCRRVGTYSLALMTQLSWLWLEHLLIPGLLCSVLLAFWEASSKHVLTSWPAIQLEGSWLVFSEASHSDSFWASSAWWCMFEVHIFWGRVSGGCCSLPAFQAGGMHCGISVVCSELAQHTASAPCWSFVPTVACHEYRAPIRLKLEDHWSLRV